MDAIPSMLNRAAELWGDEDRNVEMLETVMNEAGDSEKESMSAAALKVAGLAEKPLKEQNLALDRMASPELAKMVDAVRDNLPRWLQEDLRDLAFN